MFMNLALRCKPSSLFLQQHPTCSERRGVSLSGADVSSQSGSLTDWPAGGGRGGWWTQRERGGEEECSKVFSYLKNFSSLSPLFVLCFPLMSFCGLYRSLLGGGLEMENIWFLDVFRGSRVFQRGLRPPLQDALLLAGAAGPSWLHTGCRRSCCEFSFMCAALDKVTLCADLNTERKVKMEEGLLGLGDSFSPSCCFIAARMCLDDVCTPAATCPRS